MRDVPAQAQVAAPLAEEGDAGAGEEGLGRGAVGGFFLEDYPLIIIIIFFFFYFFILSSLLAFFLLPTISLPMRRRR